MAAVNYYLGLKRGQNQAGQVVAGTSSGSTSADVELRLQINNGTSATGLTRMDVYRALCVLEKFIWSNGLPGGTPGADLPAA